MKSIDLTITIDRPLPEAQTQVLAAIDPVMRARSLRQLPKGNTVEYRPKFVGLVVIWLTRRLGNEHVTFTFEQRGSTTELRATGRLHNRAHTELTDALAQR
jgi:hypothetical protein